MLLFSCFLSSSVRILLLVKNHGGSFLGQTGMLMAGRQTSPSDGLIMRMLPGRYPFTIAAGPHRSSLATKSG